MQTATRDAMLDDLLREAPWHDEMTEADPEAMWEDHRPAGVIPMMRDYRVVRRAILDSAMSCSRVKTEI